MRKSVAVLSLLLLLVLGTQARGKFVAVSGTDLVQPNGEKLFIVGTNLGNWLNPEGYMFEFRNTNCEWMIDLMVKQAVGPDFAAEFWQAFKDNYITRADLEYIARTGANTVRLPFNYKLFTDEDYMGLTAGQDGFRRFDDVIGWCRELGLYLILDMHDCPGGQTGDNIDNGYGYPWLFESERSQQLFCDVWQKIARRYRDEPVILGYELMNEPIATTFADSVQHHLDTLLEPLYKRAVKAIRQVDRNHIILLGGAQWNGQFWMFHDWTFDSKLMYTCHRYGGEPTKAAIQSIIDFRDKTGLPMYMGEIGHNSDEWQQSFCQVMRENNIGYTFWPYKKMGNSCMVGFKAPEGWRDVIVKYAEADRSSFQAIRDNRPAQAQARRLLMQLVENVRFENCHPEAGYIRSMGLKAE